MNGRIAGEEADLIWIARRLDADHANKLVAMNLPGLQPVLEPKRYYPNGPLAAHVLGYVGLDGDGLGGLESFYNAKIAGEPGRLFLERDANGNGDGSGRQSPLNQVMGYFWWQRWSPNTEHGMEQFR